MISIRGKKKKEERLVNPSKKGISRPVLASKKRRKERRKIRENPYAELDKAAPGPRRSAQSLNGTIGKKRKIA